MSEKNPFPLIFVVLVIIIAGTSYWYFAGKSRTVPKNVDEVDVVPTDEPVPTAVTPTPKTTVLPTFVPDEPGLKTYSNKALGLTFQYPSEVTVSEKVEKATPSADIYTLTIKRGEDTFVLKNYTENTPGPNSLIPAPVPKIVTIGGIDIYREPTDEGYHYAPKAKEKDEKGHEYATYTMPIGKTRYTNILTVDDVATLPVFDSIVASMKPL